MKWGGGVGRRFLEADLKAGWRIKTKGESECRGEVRHEKIDDGRGHGRGVNLVPAVTSSCIWLVNSRKDEVGDERMCTWRSGGLEETVRGEKGGPPPLGVFRLSQQALSQR